MSNNEAAAAPFSTILFVTIHQLVTHIIKESYIRALIARDGDFLFTTELAHAECCLTSIIRKIVASGVRLGSFEFYCALNAAAGRQAEHCERAAADLFVGRRAKHIEIWDHICEWSYHCSEALRPAVSAAVIEELPLAA